MGGRRRAMGAVCLMTGVNRRPSVKLRAAVALRAAVPVRGGAAGGTAGSGAGGGGDGGSGRGKRNWKSKWFYKLRAWLFYLKHTHANCATMSAGHMAQGP